jgi:hypothetical protein
MNREEREEYVVQLYKDGRTVRQIAELVHMSFRDIGALTNKAKLQAERERGYTIVDKIIGLSKDVVFMDSIFNQKILIESLETIATSSSGSKFRNFLPGGKVRTARDNAKRLLGCDVSNIISSINDLHAKAKRGFEIWEAIDKLLHFMNEDGINKFTKEISRGQIDLFHSQLVKIKEGLLTEFDDLQEHDKRKAELTSKEKEILDLCTTQLSGETGWKEILEQEFYAHWIDYIENEYPGLKGRSFDTYIHNRDQLSKLVKEHREIVVQKIASQINSSIIRPDITSGLSHAYKEHDDQWNELLDELVKKKHIWPVRKLIEQYSALF